MRASLMRVLHFYKKQMDRAPLLTQTVTAGALVTAGDVIAQVFIERKAVFSFRRTAIMASCGFFYLGPIGGAWFSLLNKWKFPVVASVVLDQLCAAPPVLAGFFAIQSLLNGKTPSYALHRIKTELPGVLKVYWTAWIPVQLLNFWVLPFQYRMLFVQFVALFWNSYLSVKANRVPATEPAVVKAASIEPSSLSKSD